MYVVVKRESDYVKLVYKTKVRWVVHVFLGIWY